MAIFKLLQKWNCAVSYIFKLYNKRIWTMEEDRRFDILHWFISVLRNINRRTFNDKAYTYPQLFCQFFNFRIFNKFFIYEVKNHQRFWYRGRICITNINNRDLYVHQVISLIEYIGVSIFRAQEPKAPVTYCDHALSGVRPSVVRPSSVRLFTFSTSSPEPLDGFWWNLVWMKYSRFLTSVVVFRPHLSRGGSRAGQK